MADDVDGRHLRATAAAAGLASGVVSVKAELLADRQRTARAAARRDELALAHRAAARPGIEVVARGTLADDAALLESAFRAALARADLVIATGGLGPTEDDLTREAAAAATGRGLRREQAFVESLQARASRAIGRPMAETNEKQADVIEGADCCRTRGARRPASWSSTTARSWCCCPGPPGEMKPMFEEHVLPRCARGPARARAAPPRARIAGMAESDVDEVAAPGLQAGSRTRRPRSWARPGQVELHLVAEATARPRPRPHRGAGAPAARGATRPHLQRGRPRAAAGRDDLLRERSLTLALAESCTGGLLAARLTEVPGVSAVLDRAVVTYANRAKSRRSVSRGTVDRHGAVSEEVAAAMAAGVMRAARSDVGVAITGIAGPDGGTARSPSASSSSRSAAPPGARVRRGPFRRPRARPPAGDPGRARDAAARPARPSTAVSLAHVERVKAA